MSALDRAQPGDSVTPAHGLAAVTLFRAMRGKASRRRLGRRGGRAFGTDVLVDVIVVAPFVVVSARVDGARTVPGGAPDPRKQQTRPA